MGIALSNHTVLTNDKSGRINDRNFVIKPTLLNLHTVISKSLGSEFQILHVSCAIMVSLVGHCVTGRNMEAEIRIAGIELPK